jgi:hypothetical protein
MRLVLLASLSLLAAGCMGGGGEKTTSPPLTKVEYIQKADAICARYEGELAKLPEPQTLDALAQMADAALPIAETGVERLRALTPPSDLQEQVDRWLALNEQNIRDIERLRDAAEDGDETEVQKIAGEARDNERDADLAAGAIGFRDCAATNAE